jgi:hypothetical protein
VIAYGVNRGLVKGVLIAAPTSRSIYGHPPIQA